MANTFNPNYYALIETGKYYEGRYIKSEFQHKRQSKMYQKLKRKIPGLRFIKDYIVDYA